MHTHQHIAIIVCGGPGTKLRGAPILIVGGEATQDPSNRMWRVPVVDSVHLVKDDVTM